MGWVSSLSEVERSFLIASIAIVGAVITSVASLIGVFVTTGRASSNLQRQLQHDAEQRERERVMDLRREVYLEAVESIASAAALIARLPNLAEDGIELGREYRDSAKNWNKLHITCGTASLTSLYKFSEVLATAWIDLNTKRWRAQVIENKRLAHDSVRQKHQVSRDALIERMKEHNLSLGKDAEYFNALLAQDKLAAAGVSKWMNSHNDLEKKRDEVVLEMLADVTEHLQAVYRACGPLVLAIRRELDLPIDEDAYIAALASQSTLAKQKLDTFIADMQKNALDARSDG